MPGGGGAHGETFGDRVGQGLVRGHQDGGGDDVVLGLADEVGGDVVGVGGVVGQDRDLGGPGLGVDADEALEQALGGGDPDVPGTGDHVRARAVLGAVGEHRHGLGSADRVDLFDAEQGAGGEDRRVGQSTEVLLGR